MKYPFFNGLAIHKMSFDDPIKIRLGNVVIPNAIRLDTHNGTRFTGSKAIGASSLDSQLALVNTSGFEFFSQRIE